MEENIYRPPEAGLDIQDHTALDVEVWNPDAAGAWSLLFTPIFGSVLVHKNWKSIGDTEEIEKSKKWIYISILMAVISVFFNFIGFIYIITWYFLSQKKQTSYLKQKLNGNYKKKKWLKPIFIACLGWVAVVLIISIILAATV